MNRDNTVDHYYVLGQMVEAVHILADSSSAYRLLPEVRSNLVMALDGARNIQEIAGIPGRLTHVFGKITAPAYPAWGASLYTATILLEIMKLDSSRRAAMEIKYSDETVLLMRDSGITVCHLKIDEKSSLKEILGNCIVEGSLPDAFYTEGGFAREGAIIITGGDAVEVAERVVQIAEL
jgi:predicted fused transcriptional regulator/phosphomethylpyrimidine kinase